MCWRAFSAAMIALSLMGCPRGGGDPPMTTSPSCHTVADCNAGASCGLLVACVGVTTDQPGYCEGEASLEIPCR